MKRRKIWHVQAKDQREVGIVLAPYIAARSAAVWGVSKVRLENALIKDSAPENA